MRAAAFLSAQTFFRFQGFDFAIIHFAIDFIWGQPTDLPTSNMDTPIQTFINVQPILTYLSLHTHSLSYFNYLPQSFSYLPYFSLSLSLSR